MWFDIHKANIRKLVVSWRMLSVWSRGYFSAACCLQAEWGQINTMHA